MFIGEQDFMSFIFMAPGTYVELFDVLLTVHIIDARNLFYNMFYFMPLHVSSTCAHHQEVKIALHSIWYHHTYRCVLFHASTCFEHMC